MTHWTCTACGVDGHTDLPMTISGDEMRTRLNAAHSALAPSCPYPLIGKPSRWRLIVAALRGELKGPPQGSKQHEALRRAGH